MSSTELSVKSNDNEALSLSQNGFDHIQRVARMFSESQLVPPLFQKNIPNTVIGLEMAKRLDASPLMIFQNLNVIHGKPSWSSTFIIAAINSSGKFTPLRWHIEGQGDEKTCIAWALELALIADPELAAVARKALTLPKARELLPVCESAPVSIAMAKAEGWFQKNGSKWQTMPDLMLRYRAATFFGRMFCPEILMGMKTEDESFDIDATPAIYSNETAPATDPAPLATATTEPETATRSRGKKGAGAMKAAEKVVEAEPASSEKAPEKATDISAMMAKTQAAASESIQNNPTATAESPKEKSPAKEEPKKEDPKKEESPNKETPAAAKEEPKEPAKETKAANPAGVDLKAIRGEIDETVERNTANGKVYELVFADSLIHCYNEGWYDCSNDFMFEFGGSAERCAEMFGAVGDWLQPAKELHDYANR